ncbi:hypothetical protein NL452_27455, partial [Klebsiella pneumoniae]|nr:hypothetical protein [Klebsiella pneumoniae]
FYDYTASYPEGEEGDDDDVDEEEGAIIPEDYQLRLPSGAVIGHRSLLVYYKQNLRPEREGPQLSNNRQLVNKVMSQYQV